MRWFLACSLTVAIMASGHADDKTVALRNGKVLTYNRLQVHETSVFVEMATGGKTLAFHHFKPSSLSDADRAAVRTKILKILKTADGLYNAGKHTTALPQYQFAEKCLGFVTQKDLSAEKIDGIRKKARGLIFVNKTWTTIAAHNAFKAKELEAEMTAKGMVKYKNRWVTRRKKSHMEAYDKAKSIVRLRSLAKAPITVVHRSPSKALCRVAVTGNDGVVRKLLVIVSDPLGRLKKAGNYRSNLYWSGDDRYFYDGGFRVANSYALTADEACETVVTKFHLLPQEASGTGFAITKAGHVVTNHHVTEDAVNIVVYIGKKSFKAKKVAEDATNDLAIIKIEGELQPLALTSGDAKLGQTVFTVGFPMTQLQGTAPKVTRGVVSGMQGFQDDERMYQTDVSVQAGNSGGAMADKNGNVVGVICAKASYQAFLMNAGSLPENVNYAVKKAKLMELLEKHSEIKKQLVPVADASIEFEDAVARVVKATVRIVVNGDDDDGK